MSGLNKQLTLRLTDEQRAYLKAQHQKLTQDPQLSHFRWSEGDIVRTFIEEARKANREVAITMAGPQEHKA